MSATEKFPVELSNRMRSAYTAAKTADARDAVVASFVKETGYSVRSIRGKMARDGYYVAKVRQAKDGSPAERKEAIVAGIAATLGVDVEKVESLENATKTALKVVAAKLAELVEDDEEDSAE